MERWIVVWANGTRCAVLEQKADAIETIKDLMMSDVPMEDIEVFHSDRACEAFINIE